MLWRRTLHATAFLVIVLGTSGFLLQQDKSAQLTREKAEIEHQQRLKEMRDAFAAPGAKSVHLEIYTDPDPVRIVRVLYKDQDVTPRGIYHSWDGMPFQGDDDWLKDITVVLRNTSNRVIVAASIMIDFPETGKGVPGSPVLAEVLPMGRWPDHALYRPDGGKIDPGPIEPLTWKPGQTLEFPIAPVYERALATIRSKTPLTNVTTCWVRLGSFYFPDATRWAAHRFYKPADVPGKYVPMTVEEFRRWVTE